MRGHIRRRGANSFEIKYDIGKDNDGKRQTVHKSFKGTRKQAEAELAHLLARVADGGHVDPSKLAVAEYLRSRLAHWAHHGHDLAQDRGAVPGIDRTPDRAFHRCQAAAEVDHARH